MDDPTLTLEYQNRSIAEIEHEIAEAFAHGQDVLARGKTLRAGIKEEHDAVKETLQRLSNERRKAETALRVVRMSTGGNNG